MAMTKTMRKVAEDGATASDKYHEPDLVGDVEPEKGAAMQLAGLHEEAGSDSEDDARSIASKTSTSSRKGSAAQRASTNPKKKKGKGKGKAKRRVFNDDGRLPAGCDRTLLPALGDKVVDHKAGRKGHAKTHLAPIAKAAVSMQELQAPRKKGKELASTEAAIAARRREVLLGVFKVRLVSGAYKGGRGRSASLASRPTPTLTTSRRQRARSSEAVMTTITRSATLAQTSTPAAAAQEGNTEGLDGVLMLGQEEGREEVAATGVPEQEGEGENKPDLNVSIIKLANMDNTMGLVSPRGCSSPIYSNMASSEDMVRHASSSGAAEQPPMVEGGGEREADLQEEEEGALEGSQGQGGGQQEEEGPASMVDMFDGADKVVEEDGVRNDVPVKFFEGDTMEGEGEREAHLQEQEAALEGSQGEGSGQEEEVAASSVEVFDGANTMMEAEEIEEEGVQDSASLELEGTTPSHNKHTVGEVIGYIANQISSTYQTVAAAVTGAWEFISSSCAAAFGATNSVCHVVYETIRAWGTSA